MLTVTVCVCVCVCVGVASYRPFTPQVTPLMLAAISNNVVALRLMLDAHANRETKDVVRGACDLGLCKMPRCK